jgi:hypothetical protein
MLALLLIPASDASVCTCVGSHFAGKSRLVCGHWRAAPRIQFRWSGAPWALRAICRKKISFPLQSQARAATQNRLHAQIEHSGRPELATRIYKFNPRSASCSSTKTTAHISSARNVYIVCVSLRRKAIWAFPCFAFFAGAQLTPTLHLAFPPGASLISTGLKSTRAVNYFCELRLMCDQNELGA